jgi:hypothetical protein
LFKKFCSYEINSNLAESIRHKTKKKRYEILKIRFSGLLTRFNHWNNRIDMRDIRQINGFKAAADDLWDRIVDCQYDIESIDRRRNMWLAESSMNNYAQEAIQRLNDEDHEVNEKQAALMHSYRIIMDKLLNLWKESAATATEMDLRK